MSEALGKVEVKKLPIEGAEIEWEIPNFLSLIYNFTTYRSPTFDFINNSWYLELCQGDAQDPNDLGLHLFCTTNQNFSLECSFGLKKRDGTMEPLCKFLMFGNAVGSIGGKFIKRSQVFLSMLEHAHSSFNFTIICRLQCTVEQIALNKPKLETLKKVDTLSDNLKVLFGNKESCDTILNVQDREYKAHRAILIARSSVFAAMFMHETSEKQDGIVNIIDCDPETFGEFLEFLYTGKLHKLSFHTAHHLFETSNKYNVEELKTYCLQNLAENLSVENVCDVAIIAEKYDEANLMSEAQEFFNENLHEILETSGWDSLVKDNYCLSKTLLKGMPSKKRKVCP